jgi:hypothetical protein
MTKTTGLCITLAFALSATAGCADVSGGSGENKGRGNATNNVPNIAASKDPAARPQKPLMNTREDWKNVPKPEGPRTFEPIVSKDFEGTVKAVDADRRLITVAVGGQEYTLRVSQTALIEESSLRSYALQGGLAAVPAGSSVFVVTFKEGDQDVVSRIKLRGGNPN